MSVWHMQPDIAASRRQHKQLYQVQGRYLRYVGLVALACLLYYVWFFLQFGVSGEQHPVIAEGNIDVPQKARRVVELGCYSVVVGGAITRPQLITKKFTNALIEGGE